VTAPFRPRIGTGPFRKALVLESPDPSLDVHLRAAGIEPYRPERTPTDAELLRLLESEPWELLFKRSRVEVNARVLEAAPHLHAVMLCCIGDDSVDKRACAERGVLVTNDPISNGRSVAELVMGELICLSRRVFEATDETRKGTFNKSQDRRYEIRDKVIGILGLGNIGKQVAQMAAALDMKIAFYDNREVAREVGETMGWTWAPSIRDLFAMSDYVTAHISAYDYNGRSNENAITYDHFAAFSEKESDSPRIFINLARGSIHRPEDLLRAVDEGHVRQAIVDVFPQEPADAREVWRSPYTDEKRIYGTPHIGAATLEAQPRIARYVASTTQALSHHGMLRNCVFGSRANIGFDTLEGIRNIVTVVHTSARGTRKAIADAIYDAEAGTDVSIHRDFNEYGIAYELVAIDRPLTPSEVDDIVHRAASITREPNAIRSLRQITL
jgi:D-3-phosphoglycerate dehydrogenase